MRKKQSASCPENKKNKDNFPFQVTFSKTMKCMHKYSILFSNKINMSDHNKSNYVIWKGPVNILPKGKLLKCLK